MDIRALLDYIEGQCSGAYAPVELNGNGGGATGRPLRLVFDADHCLAFFYGGVSYGWANGGQWNHMIRFLRYLVHTCLSHKIEICVFFNGTSVRGRFAEWLDRQIAKSRRIEDAIRLVSTKGFHPPKGLWMKPTGYLSVLRQALVKLGLPIASSFSDHQLEIVSFMRDNCFDGIVTCDPDIVMFNPLQRYFSARKLNLSHDGILTANEIFIGDFAKLIGLEPGHLCVLAALLGNHILPSEELQGFFSHICQLPSSVHLEQYPFSEKLNAVARFVRNLPSISNLEEIAKAVFGKEKANTQISELFKKSVDYYLQGTRATCIQIKSDWLSNGDSSFNMYSQPSQLSDEGTKKDSSTQDSSVLEAGTLKGWESDVLLSGMQNSPDNHYSASLYGPGSVDYKGYLMFNAGGYSGSSTFSHGSKYSSGYATKLHPMRCPLVKWWRVSPEVLHVALERHQKGLMTPLIYQILVHGEIFLSPFLENEREGDLWTAISLYRPIRQKIYSVLLERESKGISDGDAVVREWSVCLRPIPRSTYDSVLVPPATQSQLLYSLWLGISYDVTVLRKQMFLDCFGCKPIDSQLLTAVKPQFLILCCILRYMVIQKSSLVIDEDTLRAFLATAVSNYLQDPKAIKTLNIPVISMRNIQLATLFMHGYEAAVFANEAFGMPMPVDLFCPSNYFDGTLFQYKLTKTSQKASLTELCENSFEQQMHLERMQQTILSSLPRDCAYLCPRLWNTVPRGGGSSSHNLNLHGESYFQGSYLCSNEFSEIPYPTKGLKDAFGTPPRRALRSNARARPGRGRGNKSHKRNTNELSADKEIIKEENTGYVGKPPEPGQFRIAKRGAMGHQLTKMVPAVTGFGRGRGCTVEIELDNVLKSSVTHPVVATLTTTQFASMLGRGRSSSLKASEGKVGTQNYGSAHDSVLQSFPKAKESRLASDRPSQNDKLISCFGDAENSSLRESASADVAKVEMKAVPLLENAAVDDVDLPALIETSPTNQALPKWADLIDAEEKAISSLSLETEDSGDTLNKIAVCLTSPIGHNLD